MSPAAERVSPAEPAAAAWLYAGTVFHARLRPVGHRFRYRVTSLMIDIDRLAEADALSALFSVGRFNLLSFHEADHGPATGAALRPSIDALLAAAGVDLCGGRVLLLCYPRILGYVFDPLSVYYCYDRSGGLAALVYEVRNTFGERHSYVAPVRCGELGGPGVRQERDKLFYVSPFLGMALRYKFRIQVPGDTVALRILVCDGDAPVLAAAFRGDRRALATAALCRMLPAVPLGAIKVIGGIYWEAFRIWLKGMRMLPRPAAPPAASLDGHMLKAGGPRPRRRGDRRDGGANRSDLADA